MRRRGCSCGASRAARGRAMPNYDRRRKALSKVMGLVTSVSAALVIVALLVILFYIAAAGVSQLNIGFLVNSTQPYGDPDSGIANAIVGTLILIAIAAVVGLPIGILGGLYLAEYGSNRFGVVLRFLIDTLTGVPSIVIGVFAWTAIVKPLGHFSALSGGISRAILIMPLV